MTETEKTINKYMKSLLKVLRAAGPDRVTRAMTTICTPKYKNHGWNNCFFTQLVGGKKALNKLKTKYGTSDETNAVAHELGVKADDVSRVISLFDNDILSDIGNYEQTVGPMLSYTRRWLRDRLRRAGKPNPLLGTPAVA